MKETSNFGLTIYEPNDVLSYLTTEGWNGTMEKIDSSMKQIEDVGSQNTLDLTTLEQQVTSDHDELNNLTGEVSDLTQTVSGNTANIAGLTTRVGTAEQNITALQGQVATLGTTYRGVLSEGETTLAITIGDFTENSLVDTYQSVYGIAPLTVELRPASGGQPNLCVTTWDKQEEDMDVAVKISE